MNPLYLVEQLDRASVVLSVNGDKLAYDAPAGTMTPDLLDALRTHKPILLAMLTGNWRGAAMAMIDASGDPKRRADLLHQFSERLAICEIDGGLSEDEAVNVAFDQVAAEIDQLAEQSSHKHAACVDSDGICDGQTT